MKRLSKPFCVGFMLLLLSAMSSQAQASFIFKFDNADVPQVDFVGIEASDFYLFFGQDDFDMGDTFDLLVGSTAGGNDLAELLGVWTNGNDITGIGFGDTLGIVPATEQFFVTIVKQTGSFTVDGVNIYFNNNGIGSVFSGVRQRPPGIAVPEPGSLLLLVSSFGLMWMMRRRRHFPRLS